MIGGVWPGGSASVAFAGVKKATMVELVTIEIKTFVVFDKGLGFDRHLSKDYGLLVKFSSTVSGVSPIFSWSNRQLNHSRKMAQLAKRPTYVFQFYCGNGTNGNLSRRNSHISVA